MRTIKIQVPFVFDDNFTPAVLQSWLDHYEQYRKDGGPMNAEEYRKWIADNLDLHQPNGYDAARAFAEARLELPEGR